MKKSILVVFLATFSVLCARSQHIIGPDYQLGAGDLIEISVFGVQDFSFTRRVSSSGFITLPYVGKVNVQGVTSPQLEEELTALLDGRLIPNPQVSVFVREYQSQLCVILGAVNNPGLIEMSRPLKLLEVIALAGGLKQDSADRASIYHRSLEMSQNGIDKTDGTNGDHGNNGIDKTHGTNGDHGNNGMNGPRQTDTSSVMEVRLRALLEEGAFSENVSIAGRDVIVIRHKSGPRFYVIGEVLSPGPFELPPDKALLLTQALALSGGPMRTAKMNKGILVRYDGVGHRQQIQVNFSDILKGKKADFQVHSDDVIFIPGSTFKSIGYGLLGILPSLASQTAVTIARTP